MDDDPSPHHEPVGSGVAATFFDPDTGQVLSVFQASSPEQVALNTPEGAIVVEGAHPLDSYLKDEVIRPLPAKPAPWARWSLADEAWTDPRTPEDLAADLHLRRAAAHLPKLAFCMALMETGFLTPDETDIAVGGLIPASFQPAVDRLPPMQRDMARICWRGATVIERLDPLIAALAAELQIADATLDALFGVAP